MSRTKSGKKILIASADIQWSIADLLEAKAEEMETLQDWLLYTIHKEEFSDSGAIVMQSAAFHDQLIEILAGITSMERGLAKNMHMLLHEEQLGGDAFGSHGLEGTV